MESAPEVIPGRRTQKELLLRILSAAVLAPAGLWAVYAGGIVLTAATAACAVVASFEWTRMVIGPPDRMRRGGLRPGVFILMALGAVAASVAGTWALEYVALASLVVAGVSWGLTRLAGGAASSMALGALYTTAPFGAFVWIGSDPTDGRTYLISLLAIVWTTDIAAYFAGRGFGGPLLSPQDSPNKTWTGAIGALVCAALAGAALGRTWAGDVVAWTGFAIMVSVVAQAGDLLESRFKRMYGVKDTSGVVPGHGGVLDRLDALMAASVVVALLLQFARFAMPSVGPGS